MMRIGRLGQLSCACAARLPPRIIAATAATRNAALFRLILSSHVPAPFMRRVVSFPWRASVVGDQRFDAACEPENARSAFALDLLRREAERGNAAIDRQAIA